MLLEIHKKIQDYKLFIKYCFKRNYKNIEF